MRKQKQEGHVYYITAELRGVMRGRWRSMENVRKLFNYLIVSPPNGKKVIKITSARMDLGYSSIAKIIRQAKKNGDI